MPEMVARRPAPPQGALVRRADFCRRDGKADFQYACWNPITWQKPDFHRPEFFGQLTFE